jgi:hypothetical protein
LIVIEPEQINFCEGGRITPPKKIRRLLADISVIIRLEHIAGIYKAKNRVAAHQNFPKAGGDKVFSVRKQVNLRMVSGRQSVAMRNVLEQSGRQRNRI